jgi:hypothetical protein
MAIVYTPVIVNSTSTTGSTAGIKPTYNIEDGRNVTGNNITAPSAFNTDAVLATAVDGFSKGKASGMLEDNLGQYVITDVSQLITNWYEAFNNYYSKVQDAITNNDTTFLENYVFYVTDVATDTTSTPATTTTSSSGSQP